MNPKERPSDEELKKMYDEMPAEEKALNTRKLELLTATLPIVLMLRVKENDMSLIMDLGLKSQEYCAEFKCSPFQFMAELKILEEHFIERSILSGGISFGDKHKVPQHLRKQNRDNHKAIEQSRRAEERKPATASIGDMLKAKGIDIK